jgi:hypothetical protein
MSLVEYGTANDIVLAEHAEVIRTLGKRVVGDVVEIGRRLTDAKARCGHGNWLPWLSEQFGWEETTACRFMQVHAMVCKSGNLPDLSVPVSGLYALARPSTPEEVRDDIINQAKNGKHLTNAQVQKMIAEGTTRLREGYEERIEQLHHQISQMRADAVSLNAELGDRIEGVVAPLRNEIEHYKNKLKELASKKPKVSSSIDLNESAGSTAIKLALDDLSRAVAAMPPNKMIEFEKKLATITAVDSLAKLVRKCSGLAKWLDEFVGGAK